MLSEFATFDLESLAIHDVHKIQQPLAVVNRTNV